eukprot:688233-Amphidinium_carterae.1
MEAHRLRLSEGDAVACLQHPSFAQYGPYSSYVTAFAAELPGAVPRQQPLPSHHCKAASTHPNVMERRSGAHSYLAGES